jgi:LysR family transcriptional regulator, glycine cleavage system transcriptional activator
MGVCAPLRPDVLSGAVFPAFMFTNDTLASRLLRSVSLEALRGFEASARLQSFTAAADELSLTQSAISKQIKSLEDNLGRVLFVRGPRGLKLTHDGVVLHQGIVDALRRLEATMGRLTATQRSQVSITVTPSLATLWLVPRLTRFRDALPHIDLHIDARDARVVLEREGLDIAVRLVAPENAQALVSEQAVLVAAPAVASRIREPRDLQATPLLAYADMANSFPWMSWARWHTLLKLEPAPHQPVFRFSGYEDLLQAAATGLGLAVGRTPLVQPMLQSGTLQLVLPEHALSAFRYYLVLSKVTAERPEVQTVAAWIEAELMRDALGVQGS